MKQNVMLTSTSGTLDEILAQVLGKSTSIRSKITCSYFRKKGERTG
ncbi:MAG: hypothetical protein ACLU4J_00060 [Butyricimonas paravirosa]